MGGMILPLVGVLLLTTCTPTATTPSTFAVPTPAAAPSPGRTPFPTTTVPAHCTYRTASNGEPLPDPTCTPGAVNPDVTQDNIATTICTTGWTATIRPPESYTGALKPQLMRAYGTTTPSNRTELDHLIPLELGGAPWAVENLWPELPDPPGVPPGQTPVNNLKDRVENAAKDAVCKRVLPLDEARQAIRTDWTALGQRLGVH